MNARYEAVEPERPLDSWGRRVWLLEWEDPQGIFRPEPSRENGQPVGYRRGQICRATEEEVKKSIVKLNAR